LFFHASVFASWLFLYLHRLVLTWWLRVRMWWLAPFTHPKWQFFTCFSEKSPIFWNILVILAWWLPTLVPL
jgi:hypothetical protein